MNSNKSKSYLKFLFIFSVSMYFIFLGVLITAKSINNQYIKIHGVYSNSGSPNQTRNLLKKLNNDKQNEKISINININNDNTGQPTRDIDWSTPDHYASAAGVYRKSRIDNRKY